MRTLIIEDEIQAISALRSEISYHCPQLFIIGEARSIKEAVEKINSLKPELIFLDINMPILDGFQFLDEFEKFFKETNTNPPFPYKSYVIKSENNADKLNKITAWFDSQSHPVVRAATASKLPCGICSMAHSRAIQIFTWRATAWSCSASSWRSTTRPATRMLWRWPRATRWTF